MCFCWSMFLAHLHPKHRIRCWIFSLLSLLSSFQILSYEVKKLWNYILFIYKKNAKILKHCIIIVLLQILFHILFDFLCLCNFGRRRRRRRRRRWLCLLIGIDIEHAKENDERDHVEYVGDVHPKRRVFRAAAKHDCQRTVHCVERELSDLHLRNVLLKPDAIAPCSLHRER